MRRLITVLALASATSASAQDWVPMTAAEITQALTDQTYEYAEAWQEFRASGRTLYNAGRDSWGYWAVRGDQYCSQWPPGDQWDCYDMEQAGPGLIRFVASDGSATVGQLQQ